MLEKLSRAIRRLESPHTPDPRCAVYGCSNPAPWVETSYWDTGAVRGVSFYPLCDGCRDRALAEDNRG